MNSSEKAKRWLQTNIDQDSKNEIQLLLSNPKELDEAFYTDIEFGTGGLRGIMGIGTARMNKYTVGMATQGLANYIKKSFPNQKWKIAIAFDCRNNSKEFSLICADILSANGIEVYIYNELRTTPQLSYTIRHFNCHSGIMITASHNPKEYNGYKVYWNDGGQLVAPHDENVMAEVRQIASIDAVNFNANAALIHFVDNSVDKAYIHEVKKQLHHTGDGSLKIVFTPIHGTAITAVPQILEAANYTSVHLVKEQAVADGNFPTVHSPNPEEAAALQMAIDQAKATNADIVLGTDPDCDRVGIAVKNSKGEFVLFNGNQTAAIIINHVLAERKNTFKGNEFIAKTIVTSALLNKIAAAYGVKCYETLTGFKYIAEVIRAHEEKEVFLCGGEESYGYLIGDYVRDKDAVVASAIICEAALLAKREGKNLVDKLIDIYLANGFYKEKLVSLTFKGLEGLATIQAMMDNWRNNPPKTLAGLQSLEIRDYKTGFSKKLETNTNIKMDFPPSNVIQLILNDGSIVTARPSGTEPKIKFYFSVKGTLLARENFEEAEKQLDAKIEHMITDLQLK
jgi:phosphoglucomutase